MILPLYRRLAPVRSTPTDIARVVVESHPLLEGNRVAVFAVDKRRDGKFVVVAEVSRRLHRIWELDLTGDENPLLDEVKTAIRKAVAKQCRVKIETIALTPRHTVPCTSDGEIDLHACRTAWLANGFERMDRFCA